MPTAIIGMHKVVEIGHPGKTKKIFLVIYFTGYSTLVTGMVFLDVGGTLTHLTHPLCVYGYESNWKNKT